MAEFNANDLRVRVQSSFSAFELRRLLDSWGASPEEIEGDAAALAHRVVRLGYKRFGLGELVHKLRAEKPLTEWPDPGAEPDERWAGPPSLSGAASMGFTSETPPPPAAQTVVWRDAPTPSMSKAQLSELTGTETELDLEIPSFVEQAEQAEQAPASKQSEARPPPSKG